MYNHKFISNEFGVPCGEVHVIFHHGTPCHGAQDRAPATGRAWFFLLSRLAQVLRGRAVVTRTSFLGLVATLSSRDASRSARRKRTGCVEPYETWSTRSPALPARTEHPQGGGQEGPRSYQSFEGKEYFWAGRAVGANLTKLRVVVSRCAAYS